MRISIAIATALLLARTASTVRAECAPTAIPIGDPAVVKTLSDRLAANGVATVVASGCPVVRVTVEQRGGQLHLQVIDAFHRRGERIVRDVATAAAVIESWTLQVVEPGAWPEALPPVVAAAPPNKVAMSAIVAGGRSWIGDDGTTWVGATVGGCWRVGWSCLGGALDVGADTAVVQDVMTGSQRSRAIHALATVDAPRRLGAFTVSPGVAVGYGWNRIQQQHQDIVHGSISISHANHALRAGLHLNVSRSIGRHFAVFGGLFGDVATLRTEIPDGPRGRFGVSLGARLEAP